MRESQFNKTKFIAVLTSVIFFILCISSSSALTDSQGQIWIEAESGDQSGQFQPFVKGSSSEASGNEFITTTNEGRYNNPAKSDKGIQKYEFDVQNDGEYVLWMRTISIEGGNEFYVSINNQGFKEWSETLHADWDWSKAGKKDNAYRFNLEEGKNNLKIAYGEDGSSIDRLLLTEKMDYTPSGKGHKPQTSGEGKYVRIQAENFKSGGQGMTYYDKTSENLGRAYRNTSVDIEPSSDGGYNVGWMEDGEWLEYEQSVDSGIYDVRARIAGKDTGSTGKLRVLVDNKNVGSLVVPNTGNWQKWDTITLEDVQIPSSGNVRLEVVKGGYNLNWIEFTDSDQKMNGDNDSEDYEESSQKPFGSAKEIPGRIKAENYDKGGSGLAYYDVTEGNSGNSYRDGNVDVESSDGGYNIGWTSDGEWLEYTTEDIEPGSYDLKLRISGKDTGSTGKLRVLVGGNKAGVKSIPNTGSWHKWDIITLEDLEVSQESNELRLEIVNGGYNLDWFEFVKSGSSELDDEEVKSSNDSTKDSGDSETENKTSTEEKKSDDSGTKEDSSKSETDVDYDQNQSPYKSHRIPGVLELEDFDSGGQNISYYDTTSGNEENAYRSTDVDISDYGDLRAVSWTSGDEWLEYTTNVESGKYDIKVKATGMSNENLKLILGDRKIGTLNLSSTGGWDDWKTFTLENVQIAQSGEKILRVEMKSGGMTLDSIKFQNSSIKESCNEGRLDVNENFQLIDNQWSIPEADQCVRLNPDNSYAWEWDASGATGGPNYPQVFIGTRPWGSSTGASEFPIRRKNIEEFNVNVENEIRTDGDKWNLAEEWWLMEKKPSEEAKTYKYEVMLLLDWGEGHNHGPVMKDDLWTDKYGNTIDLWTVYEDGGGTEASFYIFRVDGGHNGGKINMKRITDYLTEKEGVDQNLWLSGVELGNEYWAPNSGSNRIDEFDVTVNGKTYESGKK